MNIIVAKMPADYGTMEVILGMYAYIWNDRVSTAYGNNGAITTVANSLEEARQCIKRYLDAAIAANLEVEELRGNPGATRRNFSKLKILLDQYVGQASYGLEPPGNFAGSCYSWNYDRILDQIPDKIIPLDQPMILMAEYGYEG